MSMPFDKARKDYIRKQKDAESLLRDHGVRKYDDTYGGRFTRPDMLWEKFYGWSPYVYAGNNPINRLDINGFADYYDDGGHFIGSDGQDNKDKFITTTEDYNNSKENSTWKNIQGNKIPSKKTMEKINSTKVDKNHESGLVQDKRGKPTEVKTGTNKSPCSANSIDLTDKINETISNGSSPDIVIHFHEKSTEFCHANLNVSEQDQIAYSELNNQLSNRNLPSTSNSIMINSNYYMVFYNGSGNTASVPLFIINQIVDK